MEGQRIVDSCHNTALFEICLEIIPSLSLNYILVIYMSVAGSFDRKSDLVKKPLLFEKDHISFGHYPALFVPLLQMAEPYSKYGCLDCIKAAVYPNFIVEICFVGLSVNVSTMPYPQRYIEMSLYLILLVMVI